MRRSARTGLVTAVGAAVAAAVAVPVAVPVTQVAGATPAPDSRAGAAVSASGSPHAASGAPVPRDTLLRVAPGTTVELRDIDGEVFVEGWARDELRAEELEEGLRFDVTTGGDRITLRPRAERGGREREGVYRLRMPAASPLVLRGSELDVEVRGLRGGAEIRNLEGDVLLEGLEGAVAVRSVDGEIRGRGLRGDLELRTVDESIDLRDVAGRLLLQTTDGDLVVEGAALTELEAGTTDGDLLFDGELLPGGRYRLTTHSGDVVVRIPRETDAEVVVSTFDGAFEADFPVLLDRMQTAGEARFTLGDGGAVLAVEAFDGEILLRERR